MNENIKDLTTAFSNSISEDIGDILEDAFEVGVDFIMEDGLLKEIPIVSTAVSLYRIGNTIWERYHIKKLLVFIKEINNGTEGWKDRDSYLEMLRNDRKKRNKELEYVLLILDHYVQYDKAKYLARLYIAYIEGSINWLTFRQYSEIIDRLLPGDRDCLNEKVLSEQCQEADTSLALKRLEALGLVTIDRERAKGVYDIAGNKLLTTNTGPYILTMFGKRFNDILDEE